MYIKLLQTNILTDQVSLSEILLWKYLEYDTLILRNCKKLKRKERVKIKNSSILSVQKKLVLIVE